MTIIEPNKNHRFFSKFLYLSVLLLILVIFNIYLYNANVSLKYNISLQEKAIQQLESSNADFRNQMYQILDPKNLIVVAQEEYLIPDKNPQYLANR